MAIHGARARQRRIGHSGPPTGNFQLFTNDNGDDDDNSDSGEEEEEDGDAARRR